MVPFWSPASLPDPSVPVKGNCVHRNTQLIFQIFTNHCSCICFQVSHDPRSSTFGVARTWIPVAIHGI
jgi:hypothetical protein